MTHVMRLMVSLLALTAFASPQVALAVGPQSVPRVLVTEGFETATSANYVTGAYVNLPDQNGAVAGYWGRWAYWRQSGTSSLWCDGTNSAAVAAATKKYAEKSAGHVSFPLSMTGDYYSSVATFYYRMPSLGYQEQQIPAFVPQWAPSPNPGYYQTGANPTMTSALGASFEVTLTPSKALGGLSLSRSQGEFRLQWEDQKEIDVPTPRVHTGEGPSVDDVVIAGWKYGPVRSLAATSTSSSAKLTWARPWRSTAETSTEERALSYRVWRAPKGTSSWAELTTTDSRLPDTALTFTDTTVNDATAYTYAVQAWDPGAGTESGEHRQIDVTTTPLSNLMITISSPASGSVLVGTGASTVSGTASPSSGATIDSVAMTVRRDDNRYYNGLTGTWTSAPATVIAVVAGTGWSANWTPPTGDYLEHAYSIQALVTDTSGATATASPATVRVDSVPFVAPVAAVTSPSADTTVVGTGPLTLSGTASVQPGLPEPQVAVRISRGTSTWWNGTAWTSTNATVAATVVGSSWSVAVTPPPFEYATSSFAVTALATDAHGLTGVSAPISFKIDSVPFVAPTASIALPFNGEDLVGSGPFTLRGMASAQQNLPLREVRLTIARDDGTWWNGSTWTGAAASVIASGAAAWSYDWQPPAGELLSHRYDIVASATDAHGLVGSSPVVNVRVNTTVANSGPRLLDARSRGTRSVELHFSRPVDRGTVERTDFRSSLRLIGVVMWSRDGRRARISTAPQRADRHYTVWLKPGAVADRYGNASIATTAVPVRR